MASKTELANVYRLRVFMEVVEHLSFSRAAQALFITQPAVSNHIKQLERIVGNPLFTQRTRGLQVTEAGQAVYQYAQRLVALAEEMESVVVGIKGGLGGHVLIEADGLWEQFLPDLLAEFQLAHPKVNLMVRFATSRAVTDAVLENRAGLGFVYQRPRNAALEEVQVGVYRSPMVVITHPGHPLAHQATVAVAELERHPFVYYPPQQPGNVIGHFERLGVRPRYVMEIASLEGIKRAVARGLGISVLVKGALRHEARIERLAQIPLEAPPIEWGMLAIRKKSRQLSSAERAVLEFVTAGFGAAISAE